MQLEQVEEALAAQHRRATLMKLCEDLGVRYLTRARNEQAKAGNLNNGLAHSTGELIAVFDADHAPARDFLTSTVGYFAEHERLFLVQTPHFFINPDPLERNLRTFERMPSERDVLAYPTRPRQVERLVLLRLGGAPAQGLDETDGFSGRSITED